MGIMTSASSSRLPTAVYQTTNNNQTSSPGFCRRVATVAKAMFECAGASALVAIAATNPTITSAMVVAFEKVSSAFGHAGSYISANSTAFAGGVIGAGVLNVIDGFGGMSQGALGIKSLVESESKLPENAQGSQAFSKLKALYAGTQRRGALQTALGVVATTVGAVCLAGLITSPHALLAVGAVAALAYVGFRIQKHIVNHKINLAMRDYDQHKNAKPDQTVDAQTTGSD